LGYTNNVDMKIRLMKLAPKELMAELVKETIRKQMHDKEISQFIKKEFAEKGAEGRSAQLLIEGVGNYAFKVEKGLIKYLGDIIKNPTVVIIIRGKETIKSLLLRQTTAWREFRKGTIDFKSTKGDDLYHATVLMELLEKMREVLGI